MAVYLISDKVYSTSSFDNSVREVDLMIARISLWTVDSVFILRLCSTRICQCAELPVSVSVVRRCVAARSWSHAVTA